MSGNTVLFSPKTGDVNLPITPPAPATNAPGSMDNMIIGQSVPQSGAFTTISVQTPIVVGGLVPVNPTAANAATTDTFAAAVAITAKINLVVTAAFASGTPFALPSVATWLGSEITIFNQTTHTVAVWPQPGDGIDVLGTTTPDLLDAGKRAAYYAVAPANATTSLGQILSAALGTTAV